MVCEAQEMLRRVRLLDGALGKRPLSHLLSLCVLVPAAAPLRERIERLFVRMPPVIDAADLETTTEREAVIAGAGAALAPDESAGANGGAEIVRVAGLVDAERVHALVTELRASPLGSAIPWILCAELLGTSIEYRGASSVVLETYRRHLLERLVSFADQSPQIFRRWLAAGEERDLDARLAVVLDALRGAAALATA